MIHKLLSPFIKYETVTLVEGKIIDLYAILERHTTYFNRFHIMLPYTGDKDKLIYII